MKEVPFALLLLSYFSQAKHHHHACQERTLSKPIPAPHNVSFLLDVFRQPNDFADISRRLFLEHKNVLGVVSSSKAERHLALNVSGRLKIFANRTVDTAKFWDVLIDTKTGWRPAFKECQFLRTWVYVYVVQTDSGGAGVFLKIELDQCDSGQIEIFNGSHLCDPETTQCLTLDPDSDRRGNYLCMCRNGFYHHGANLTWSGFRGEDIERSSGEYGRCIPCPRDCQDCEPTGICTTERGVYLKTVILCIQLACMASNVVLALIVFRQRKVKAIASSMWTILETILLGIFILHATVVVKFFQPSIVQCLLEPWFREMGFVICYGAIILKLYRHLIEFRTRKAHRWVVKDTDLLKYLLIMIASVFAYMSAYTAITLNFIQEDYSLLYIGQTIDGEFYKSCKPLWWDYVTEAGEIVILIFGIHLSYACRNARTQYQERTYLCAAISIELAVSSLFYAVRVWLLPGLPPHMALLAWCVRAQLSQTAATLLIFVPKFFYQQKQVRNLAQEYSCRLPVDAFKLFSVVMQEAAAAATAAGNAHPAPSGGLSGNNSDVEVGEVTLADMSPEDIRAELKRLYLQLEMFKSKTICKDNPHISKRRGGRKAQHRRFSLQNLHGGKHKDRSGDKNKRHHKEEEVTEAEPSRTPEDSVCSNEGPSGIYADLPSGNADQK
ncbi:unnamed protein product [Callosobruchus maculatus]|uniref:G-protein coupled receptors family 3 profile domain-containing protein n=1 Tax=Callosobruchus maculatus TaxID=64391 RepID=A0A653DEI9_CALMS|nr:unnamed protein product [Callosobruchus maculatus]